MSQLRSAHVPQWGLSLREPSVLFNPLIPVEFLQINSIIGIKSPIYLCILPGLAGKRQTGLSAILGHNDQDERASRGWGYWKVLRGEESGKGIGRVNVLSKVRAEATCWVWHQRTGLGAQRAGNLGTRALGRVMGGLSGMTGKVTSSSSEFSQPCPGAPGPASYLLWDPSALSQCWWVTSVCSWDNVFLPFANWHLLWKIRPTHLRRIKKPKQLAR